MVRLQRQGRATNKTRPCPFPNNFRSPSPPNLYQTKPSLLRQAVIKGSCNAACFGSGMRQTMSEEKEE